MRHKHDPPLYLAAVNGRLTFHGEYMHALLHQIIPLHQKLEKKRADEAYLAKETPHPGESYSRYTLRKLFGDKMRLLVPNGVT